MILKKNILIAIVTVISIQFAVAQNSMKEPVSFKLKNGITVIVAENTGLGKVFASVSSENNISVKPTITESLDNLLNLKAKQALSETFGESNKKINPSVKFTNTEANVASDVNDFSSTFSIMSTTLQGISIDKNTVQGNASLNDIKSFYSHQFNPSKTYITIAGDITLAQAKVLVKKTFGDWKEQDFLAAN